MKKLSAIAFDLDGTLYPNPRMYLSSSRYFLRRLNLITQFYRIRKEIHSGRAPELSSREELLSWQAEKLSREIGLSQKETENLIQKEIYEAWELKFTHLRAFRTLKPFLEELKERHIPLAVMSDFPPGNKLKFLGVDSYFQIATTSEEFGTLKPDPKAFQGLAAQLGFSPSDILYVGNNYEYDIIGAKLSGFQTAHLCRMKQKKRCTDICFSGYRDLQNQLQKTGGLS